MKCDQILNVLEHLSSQNLLMSGKGGSSKRKRKSRIMPRILAGPVGRKELRCIEVETPAIFCLMLYSYFPS